MIDLLGAFVAVVLKPGLLLGVLAGAVDAGVLGVACEGP